MSPMCRRPFRTGTLAFALLAVWPFAPAAEAPEKAQITKARAEADAKLAAQEAECQQRFAVTDCVLAAREQHRAVVEPLRRDLIVLDERERKLRATQRLERLRVKAEAARNAASAASAASSPAPPASGSTAAPRSTIRPRLRSAESPSAEASAVQPDVQASSPQPTAPVRAKPAKRLTPLPDPNAAQHSADRVREAEARREGVLKRNAERNAKKPLAAPLPVPEAALPSSAASQPR